ncbi:hypothetical protein [Psychrobacter sp.]|uniref:hypothetical protein n=1 Tax=Psychrobacter sp. TaxID=56811 RepID=UPI0025F3D568|nr:hypothetical protein [Psychrobacter sp.]
MRTVSNISCLCVTALLLSITGCATQQGLESSDKGTIFSTKTSQNASQSKGSDQITNQGNNQNIDKKIDNTPGFNKLDTIDSMPQKQTFFFSAKEIKELSTAFKAGSCDLNNLNRQTKKYGFSDTWVNLYDRSPKPLSTLSKQEKCFLAQSNEVYAYGDEFEDESKNSLNDTWYKGNIPSDAKVVTIRYMTPLALISKCDPKLGRPIFIDYDKDEEGKIVRTILVNEDFDFSCVQ